VDCDPAFVVTGLKAAEEGKGSILRGYDSSGKGCDIDLHPAGGLSFAAEVNLGLEWGAAPGQCLDCGQVGQAALRSFLTSAAGDARRGFHLQAARPPSTLQGFGRGSRGCSPRRRS